MNKTIKLNKNLTEKQAIKLAKKELIVSEEESRKKSFVYIIQPDVSDLVVVQYDTYKKCTDKEWSYYFHNILYPID